MEKRSENNISDFFLNRRWIIHRKTSHIMAFVSEENSWYVG